MTAPRPRKARRAPPLEGPWEAAFDRMLAKRAAAEAAAKKVKAEARPRKSGS